MKRAASTDDHILLITTRQMNKSEATNPAMPRSQENKSAARGCRSCRLDWERERIGTAPKQTIGFTFRSLPSHQPLSFMALHWLRVDLVWKEMR